MPKPKEASEPKVPTKKVRYTGSHAEVMNALSGIWKKGEVKKLPVPVAEELVARSGCHEYAKGATADGS